MSKNLESDKPHLPVSVVFGTIAVNLLALVMPMVTLQIYDRIIPNQAIGTLGFLILGVIGVFAVDAIFRVARSRILYWQATCFEEKKIKKNRR